MSNLLALFLCFSNCLLVYIEQHAALGEVNSGVHRHPRHGRRPAECFLYSVKLKPWMRELTQQSIP